MKCHCPLLSTHYQGNRHKDLTLYFLSDRLKPMHIHHMWEEKKSIEIRVRCFCQHESETKNVCVIWMGGYVW